MDFLVANNLLLANIENRKHTFQKYDGRGTLCAQGFPDHTLANPKLINNIHDWEVIDTENNSDHLYIQFNISLEPVLSLRRRFNTEKC